MVPFIFQFCRPRTVSIQYLQVILIQILYSTYKRKLASLLRHYHLDRSAKKEKFIIGEFEHFRLSLGRDDVSELIGKNV